MEEQTKNQTKKSEEDELDSPHFTINWKVLIIGFVILGIVYAGGSMIIKKGVFNKDQTVYCEFKRNIGGILPRNECGVLKIVTKDIDQIDFVRFKNASYSTLCTTRLEELSICHGDSYHLLKYPLNSFCSKPPCNTRGYVCGAYYITYANSTNATLKEDFENNMFVDNNIFSEESLMRKFKECGVE